MPSVFKNRVSSGLITNLGHKDFKSFLEDARTLFEKKINVALETLDSLMVSAEVSGEFMIIKNDIEEIDVKHFNTASSAIFKTTDLREFYDNHVVDPTLNQVEEFEVQGSGWSLRQVLSMIISIKKYQPSHAGEYIPLPTSIQNKHCCVNVESRDGLCFKWSILAGLYPAKHNPNRVSSYLPYANVLNFKNLTFPISL